MMKTKILTAGVTLALLTGCTMELSTVRHEVAPSETGMSRVSVSINDSNLGGGEQAYVNASIIAQLKASVPGSVMVGAGEDLSITVDLLPANLMQRWYTIVTFGVLKQYFQLGSVRVVSAKSGKILAVHEVLLKGRRNRPLGLIEYQTLVLPEVVRLIQEEMKNNGIASGERLEIDVSDTVAAL